MSNISIIISPPKKKFSDFLLDYYQDKEEEIIIYKEYLLESKDKKDKKCSKKKNKKKYDYKNKKNFSIKTSKQIIQPKIINDIIKNIQKKRKENEKLTDFNKRLSLLCNKRKRNIIKDNSETSVSSISKFF